MGDVTVSSWLSTEMSSNTSRDADDTASVYMNMSLWEKALLSGVLLIVIVGTIVGNILVMSTITCKPTHLICYS